jgi:hypothetical protein
VQFKPVSGKGDQGAGLVWRYQDANNYYITRCNALEDNCTIYHVVKGSRQAFLNKNVKVATNVWHTLRGWKTHPRGENAPVFCNFLVERSGENERAGTVRKMDRLTAALSIT